MYDHDFQRHVNSDGITRINASGIWSSMVLWQINTIGITSVYVYAIFSRLAITMSHVPLVDISWVIYKFKQALIYVLIISQVFPASGPENGGTNITIYGQNLGNPKDNITVKIYGVECTNVEVLRLSSV